MSSNARRRRRISELRKSTIINIVCIYQKELAWRYFYAFICERNQRLLRWISTLQNKKTSKDDRMTADGGHEATCATSRSSSDRIVKPEAVFLTKQVLGPEKLRNHGNFWTFVLNRRGNLKNSMKRAKYWIHHNQWQLNSPHHSKQFSTARTISGRYEISM